MTVNLLEPWVLLRIVAGCVAFACFARAAFTAQRVLRRFDLSRATEGQLALERRMELATTFVRVGAVVQTLGLALSALAADRLSRGVKGAMCAYGVFSANEWGFRSLAATGIVALAAGTLTQLLAFDARVRGLDLSRPIAMMAVAMAPLSAMDLALSYEFLSRLDLTAVASCCSLSLDPAAAASGGFARGPRVLVSVVAAVGTVASIGFLLVAARTPSRARIAGAGLLALAVLPFALAASVLEVAPHAFEVPSHVCPFCLLRADVFAIGVPLYGALFLASVWAAGAALGAVLARGAAARDALSEFARRRLRRGAAAWAVALALGIAPVLRFSILSGGASLFP